MAILSPLTRIPSSDKIIDSWLLNRLGVQVARMVTARMIYRARSVAVDPGVIGAVRSVWEDGIVVLPDFLPADHFEAIRGECDLIETRRERLRPSTWGPNRLNALRLREVDPSVVRAIRAFWEDPKLTALAAGAERRPLGPLGHDAELEWLVQGTPADTPDPQTICHSDIFFNTHKIWFYLDDVGLEHGPLAYVKGSHRLTPARLSFAYEHSWMRDPASDPSRRIETRELDRCGGKETVVTCRRNTLVIANTCGYHRRLQGQAGQRRRSLHVSLRANPFRLVSPRSRRAG